MPAEQRHDPHAVHLGRPRLHAKRFAEVEELMQLIVGIRRARGISAQPEVVVARHEKDVLKARPEGGEGLFEDISAVANVATEKKGIVAIVFLAESLHPSHIFRVVRVYIRDTEDARHGGYLLAARADSAEGHTHGGGFGG